MPYVNKLIEKIQSRFSDEGVAVFVAASVFNPAVLLQIDDPIFRTYGTEEIKQLAAFYIKFHYKLFKFPPVIDGDALLYEWTVFRRALLHEKEAFLSSKTFTKSPTFQQLFKAFRHPMYLVVFSLKCSS